MNDFILTCCSTTDLEEEMLKANNVQYVPFHYTIDEMEYEDDFGKTMKYEDFYEKIKNGATPTTSQVNSEQYINFWEPILKEGKDILHVAFSSGLSGSYNSALIAKKTLDIKYPERKLYVVDSLAASSGYGMLMMYLVDLKNEGKNIDECYEWVENYKLKIHHWFFSTDLTSFKRGGRISSTSFFLGQLLKICPLLNVDKEGRLIPRKKVRTKEKTIIEMVKVMEENVDDGIQYNGKCYICNSASKEDAEKVAKLIEEKFTNLKGKIKIFSIGTVVGSHTGPGTVALFFMGKKRVN